MKFWSNPMDGFCRSARALAPSPTTATRSARAAWRRTCAQPLGQLGQPLELGSWELGKLHLEDMERLKERLKDMKSGNNLWFIEIEIGFGWFGDEHSSRFDIFIGYLAASHMEIWGWVTNNFMGIPVQWDITNYVWCIRCSGLSDFDGW